MMNDQETKKDVQKICKGAQEDHRPLGRISALQFHGALDPVAGTVLGDSQDEFEAESESEAVANEAEYDGLQEGYQETRKDVNAQGQEDHDHALLLLVVLLYYS
ncbi:hypothetical protein ACFX15_017173 [Malus domestica]